MKNSICVFLLLSWLAVYSCKPENRITPEKIIAQLKPGEGWSVKEPNRANFYQYKIAKDSGYAAITVSVLKEELFCKYKYTEYETASDLAKAFSFADLKKQFEECESSDERATPVLLAVRDTTVGNVPAAVFISDYRMADPEVNLAIEYYVIRGREGWIFIGTAFKREEEMLQRKEIRDRLKDLHLAE